MAKEKEISNLVKVVDLSDNDQQVNLYVKILEKQTERTYFSRKDNKPHRVAEFLVGDETAAIVLTAWDDRIDKLKVGKVYKISNSFVNSFNGYLRLNVGKHTHVEEANNYEIPNVNTIVNLSERPNISDQFLRFSRVTIKGEKKPSRVSRRRRRR
ncbi:MAG: hypothetical protein DRO67_01460 [Candidatus Asgardarchaeum californiense]|nr:MAG: hypothetical protein DRO67_01460 [Candidatus Asgardarchaeum californiense]